MLQNSNLKTKTKMLQAKQPGCRTPCCPNILGCIFMFWGGFHCPEAHCHILGTSSHYGLHLNIQGPIATCWGSLLYPRAHCNIPAGQIATKVNCHNCCTGWLLKFICLPWQNRVYIACPKILFTFWKKKINDGASVYSQVNFFGFPLATQQTKTKQYCNPKRYQITLAPYLQ